MSSIEKFLINPPSKKEDLGKPLADSVHAVSVAMPLWEHVVAYEEGDLETVNALQTGYPRFLIHPLVRKLFLEVQKREGRENPCYVFPSLAVAKRAADFVVKEFPDVDLEIVEQSRDLVALFFPAKCESRVKSYWQHTGEVITSRRAESYFSGSPEPEKGLLDGLRKRVASFVNLDSDDVYIYPSGMTAIYSIFRAIKKPGSFLQFGFPYVDTLKILERFSEDSIFLSQGDRKDVNQLSKLVSEGGVRAVFCEFPSNPLLHSVPIIEISKILRGAGVPLIIDDTIGSFYNVNLFPYADAITSSLTKFFSGKGDCMGGALTLNQDSPFYREFRAQLDYENINWHQDLACLLSNSEDYRERIKRINKTCEQLCDYLSSVESIEEVYYPKYKAQENYLQCRKPEGGYGGLFSLVFKGGEVQARKFYDALDVCKGPNLGTNYTLVCPFVLLAHYDELEWAESCGIKSHLVRVSVGLEDIEDLINRFKEAIQLSL